MHMKMMDIFFTNAVFFYHINRFLLDRQCHEKHKNIALDMSYKAAVMFVDAT